GQILTRRLTTAAGEHVFARHFEMWQLIKGPGYAEDVANAMLFLASDESRFITAEMMNIDGGGAAKLEDSHSWLSRTTTGTLKRTARSGCPTRKESNDAGLKDVE